MYKEFVRGVENACIIAESVQKAKKGEVFAFLVCFTLLLVRPQLCSCSIHMRYKCDEEAWPHDTGGKILSRERLISSWPGAYRDVP
ncbi:MAG: hypothetical protein DDT20_01921 [Firmicutes bacterium]|nr:hypothetical protein [Bacillota bacterium]